MLDNLHSVLTLPNIDAAQQIVHEVTRNLVLATALIPLASEAIQAFNYYKVEPEERKPQNLGEATDKRGLKTAGVAALTAGLLVVADSAVSYFTKGTLVPSYLGIDPIVAQGLGVAVAYGVDYLGTLMYRVVHGSNSNQ